MTDEDKDPFTGDFEHDASIAIRAISVSLQTLYAILLKKGIIEASDLATTSNEEVADTFDIEVERAKLMIERAEQAVVDAKEALEEGPPTSPPGNFPFDEE